MRYRKSIFNVTSVVVASLQMLAISPSSSAMQNSSGEVEIRVVSEDSGTAPHVDQPRFAIRRARLPVFVDVNLAGGGGLPHATPETVSKVVAEVDRHPRRLVTIRLNNVALRFADLSNRTRAILMERLGDGVIAAYEGMVAGAVLDLVVGVKSERSGAPLAIKGLPFEGGHSDADAANESYARVIDEMSALVLGGGMLVAGEVNEAAVLRRAYPNALKLAEGRAILFSADGGWRIATEIDPSANLAIASENLPVVSASTTPGLADTFESNGDFLASPVTDSIGGAGSTGPAAVEVGVAGTAVDASVAASGNGITAGSAGSGGFGGGGGSGWPTGSQEFGGDAGTENEPNSSAAGESSGATDGEVGESEGSDEGMSEDGVGGTSGESEASGDDVVDGSWNPEDEVIEEGDDVVDAGDSAEESDQEDEGAGGGEGQTDSGSSGHDEPAGDGGDPPADSGGGDSSGDESQAWANRLVPGGGFSGTTPEPGPIPGSGPFSDKECVVRWNVVHLREYREAIRVGVVAFHANGVERVLFECDGGEIAAAEAMELNPRTGNREFSVVLEPAAEDGIVEIRATVIPKEAGLPVVLQGDWTADSAGTGRHSLFLVSNAHETLETLEYYVDPEFGNDSVGSGGSNGDPFATIARAILEIGTSDQPRSCQIRLKRAGTYRLWNYTSGFGQRPDGLLAPNGVQNNEWITISPVDGLDRDEVILVSSGGGGVPGEPSRAEVNHNTSFIHYKNLCVDLGTVISIKGGNGRWYDNCELYDGSGLLQHPDPGGGQSWWVRGDSIFATDTEIHDTLLGFCGMTLVRNSSCTRVYADQFTHSKMVVGSRSDEAAGTVLTYHADCHQWWGPVENIIVFDVDHIEPAFMQGFYLDDLEGTTFKNIAIVDVGFDNPRNGASSEQTQIHGPAENMIFAHVSLPWQFVTLKTEQAWNPFQPDDVLFYGCVFRRLFNHGYNTPGLPEGAFVENCHFQDAGTTGPHPGTTSGPVVMELSSDGTPAYSGAGAAGVMTAIPVFSEASSEAVVWRGNLPPE